MISLLLNTVALDPNRWMAAKQPFYDLEALLEPVAAAGFRQLEVWQYHLSTLSDAGVEALVERAQALGVTFPIVGLYPSMDLEGEALEREWSAVETLVRRAERLGAGAVKMFAGRLGTADADSDTFERSVAFARRLEALSSECGLTLIAETHPDTLCDSVDATLRVLDRVDELSLCYQPFDFGSTEQTVNDFHALAPHAVHVHLQGRRGDAMSLLEDADVDYREVFDALAERGFEGALSIEFVEGCVVERPEAFDLGLVLDNARRDRAFIEAACANAGLSLVAE